MSRVMAWDVVLFVAFSAIGCIQYIKGFAPSAPSWIWAALQPAACVLLSLAWTYLPPWVSQGLLALALSQIGYETIIQTVKKLIENATGASRANAARPGRAK